MRRPVSALVLDVAIRLEGRTVPLPVPVTQRNSTKNYPELRAAKAWIDWVLLNAPAFSLGIMRLSTGIPIWSGFSDARDLKIC